MTYEDIQKVLKKHNITTLDKLEYCLAVYQAHDDCMDDPEDKNCSNSNCYEDYFVPDCRKIIEVYKKYFQKDLQSKKMFITYINEHTEKSKSSIDNYLSCKSCNQQIAKGIQNSVKIPDSNFKKDFCNNLDTKFSYTSLFETDYISINQFLAKEHEVTSDTFTPIYSEETMTKQEEKKLFDIVHTSKSQFKKNITIEENLIGSEQYLFNLAKYTFDRNLVNECEMLLEKLSKEFSLKKETLQLKAKVLSSQNRDKEAILILTSLIETTQGTIDSETHNLLAASIKREAISEYERYSDEVLLVEKLSKALDIYHSIFTLNNDYYPALNYIYLSLILAYIEGKDESDFRALIHEMNILWNNLDLKATDWWSYIANVEFLIITGNYDDAKKELELHFNDLESDDITDFNIASTIRQLNLYYNFCPTKELSEIIEYIQKI